MTKNDWRLSWNEARWQGTDYKLAKTGRDMSPNPPHIDLDTGATLPPPAAHPPRPTQKPGAAMTTQPTELEAVLEATATNHITIEPSDHIILMVDPLHRDDAADLGRRLADKLGIPHDRFTVIGGGRTMFTINTQHDEQP